MSQMFTLKKIGLATFSVLAAGVMLAGCSPRETWKNLNQTDDIMKETSPAPEVTKMAEPTPAEMAKVTPEPTQSSSNEVKDLEVDLKAVKFDSENFQ